MNALAQITTIRRPVAAIFIALLALTLPLPGIGLRSAHAQPILGKHQQAAAVAPAAWQPIADMFAGPGHSAAAITWPGIAAETLAAPAPLAPIQLTPWLILAP